MTGKIPGWRYQRVILLMAMLLIDFSRTTRGLRARDGCVSTCDSWEFLSHSYANLLKTNFNRKTTGKCWFQRIFRQLPILWLYLPVCYWSHGHRHSEFFPVNMVSFHTSQVSGFVHLDAIHNAWDNELRREVTPAQGAVSFSEKFHEGRPNETPRGWTNWSKNEV